MHITQRLREGIKEFREEIAVLLVAPGIAALLWIDGLRTPLLPHNAGRMRMQVDRMAV
jgi:hypothetical protein